MNFGLIGNRQRDHKLLWRFWVLRRDHLNQSPLTQAPVLKQMGLRTVLPRGLNLRMGQESPCVYDSACYDNCLLKFLLNCHMHTYIIWPSFLPPESVHSTPTCAQAVRESVRLSRSLEWAAVKNLFKISTLCQRNEDSTDTRRKSTRLQTRKNTMALAALTNRTY